MELSQLRMLKTVCDTGSIARAAEVLHCVPSNITARLKSLERELGTPLFFREGRGLRVSPAGEVFLEYATKILSLTEEARRAVAPTRAPSGPLRIGAIESSATGRLPQLLAKYHAQYPQVSLELSTGTWAQLLDDIQHHRLDGVIVAVDIERPGLKRAVMYREDLVLIASSPTARCAAPPICKARQSSCGPRAVRTAWRWNSGCCVMTKCNRSSASPVMAPLLVVSAPVPASRWCPGGSMSNIARALVGQGMSFPS